MDIQEILFKIMQCAPGLLLAVIVHEYAHGYVAKLFGDDTAERDGRLTFNPAVHIDMMGTVVFPLIGVIFGWGVIGWAKPVPVTPRNFKNVRKGIFWVSFAGPLSNFILGTISGILFAVLATFLPKDFSLYAPLLYMLQYSVFINFLLGAFNLIPFPPLDGSRMVASFLKGEALHKYESLAQYAPMVILLVFGLSMMGIPTLHYVLTPFLEFGQNLPLYFLRILG